MAERAAKPPRPALTVGTIRGPEGGYQKVYLSGSYRINSRIKWYATIENFMDQDYEPAFGFPALPINVRTGVTVTLGGR